MQSHKTKCQNNIRSTDVCLWIKLTPLIHRSSYHLHLYTLITFTDFITFLMFAAAFPDSQDSTDGIWGLWWIGCSCGNRWCWWCCRGQRSAWGNIRERQMDRDRDWVEEIEYLTNFIGVRLHFVSDDSAKTQRELAQRSHCVVKHIEIKLRSSVPVDGADAGCAVLVTHSLQQQPVSDLPGEHGGVGVFQIQDRLHNSGGGHFGLRASDHSWSDASCLIVPASTMLTSVSFTWLLYKLEYSQVKLFKDREHHMVLRSIHIKNKLISE